MYVKNRLQSLYCRCRHVYIMPTNSRCDYTLRIHCQYKQHTISFKTSKPIRNCSNEIAIKICVSLRYTLSFHFCLLTQIQNSVGQKKSLKLISIYEYNWTSVAEPDFVSVYEIGDYVYFFFRETAVEFINCGKVCWVMCKFVKEKKRTSSIKQCRCISVCFIYLFIHSFNQLISRSHSTLS